MVIEHLFWVRAEAVEQNVCGVGLKDRTLIHLKVFVEFL